jgi:hypothetical protein
MSSAERHRKLWRESRKNKNIRLFKCMKIENPVAAAGSEQYGGEAHICVQLPVLFRTFFVVKGIIITVVRCSECPG